MKQDLLAMARVLQTMGILTRSTPYSVGELTLSIMDTGSIMAQYETTYLILRFDYAGE